MKSRLAPLLLFLIGTEPTLASEAPSPLLQSLSRMEAPAAEWAEFGEGSSVRGRLHSVGADLTGYLISEDSTQVRVTELRSRTEKSVTVSIWNGERTDLIASIPFALDDPEFAAANATRLPDDSFPVGDQVYPAQVYQFERISDILGEKRHRRWTFWLSADVPGGVLRKITESVSEHDTSYGWREELKLVALEVPFSAGGSQLRCYALDTFNEDVNGTSFRKHTLFSEKVPGKMVSATTQVLKDGKEVGKQEWVLVDFHAEPLGH